MNACPLRSTNPRRLQTAALAHATCGVWAYSLDRKGRLMLPLDLARHCGDQVVVALRQAERGPVLLLLTAAQWARECELHGHRLEWWQAEAGAAMVVPVAANRRFALPYALRSVCGLQGGDEVVIRRLGEVAEVLPLREWQRQVEGWTR